MTPNLPAIQYSVIITALFAVVICGVVLTVNPDSRNERVECLTIEAVNPYQHTSQAGHIINTGLFSYWLYKLIPDYRVLALMFWAVILWSVRNNTNWLLLILFMILALRTAVYQHEEVYFGMPLVYFAGIVSNKYLKGILTGISLTVRPVYIAYLLPYFKSERVWVSAWITGIICFIGGVLTFGISFVDYNNFTSIFRGGTEINYTFWFLDYALFILLPIIWET